MSAKATTKSQKNPEQESPRKDQENIEFLQRLVAGASRTIFLLVDHGLPHHAKKTAAFVETLGGKLQLDFSPPYAPDRNPTNWGRCISLKFFSCMGRPIVLRDSMSQILKKRRKFPSP